MNIDSCFWLWTLKIKNTDNNNNPADAEEWNIHLGRISEVKEVNPEGMDMTGYTYHSCCGKDTVTTGYPPSFPDENFFVDPPTPGSKYEEYYCKDCIRIWRNMQS